MEWYEDSSSYQWVGHVEFGHNSVYDFELYRDVSTGDIVVCDHEDSDQPMPLNDLVNFALDYTDDVEQVKNFNDLMTNLNINIKI